MNVLSICTHVSTSSEHSSTRSHPQEEENRTAAKIASVNRPVFNCLPTNTRLQTFAD
jgi:hypothetical protein